MLHKTYHFQMEADTQNIGTEINTESRFFEILHKNQPL